MARPLTKTYSPTHPFFVERYDQEDGSIHYEIWDHRPDTYRRLCTVCEDESPDRGEAKKDAELIVRALNMLTRVRHR